VDVSSRIDPLLNPKKRSLGPKRNRGRHRRCEMALTGVELPADCGEVGWPNSEDLDQNPGNVRQDILVAEPEVGRTVVTSDTDSLSETFTIEEISAFDPESVEAAYREIVRNSGEGLSSTPRLPPDEAEK